MPYPNGEKIRAIVDGKRRFFFEQGKDADLFLPPDNPVDAKVAFLCEGETDTMRLWQEFRGQTTRPAIFGIGGCHTWNGGGKHERHSESLEGFDAVFVLLDNDEDYTVVAQVDAAWRRIRHDLGLKARRIRLPKGAKDVCEFFQHGYDLDSLRLLANRNGPGKSRYSPLDLTRDPEPPKWLLENTFAQGDVNLLVGREGLGKSFFTMGLAVATADGLDEFLGRRVMHHGRVLYVDQENPGDVIPNRLRRLGLTTRGANNIRYLWNCGIRLDRKADEFLEEAVDFNPALIIIDSLSRIHAQDENSAGQMGPLFNDGLMPLARETGACVVLIHHDNKADQARGSVDITASVDNVLHVSKWSDNAFVLKQGKSRRVASGEELTVQIKDTEDGRIVLDYKDIDPGF